MKKKTKKQLGQERMDRINKQLIYLSSIIEYCNVQLEKYKLQTFNLKTLKDQAEKYSQDYNFLSSKNEPEFIWTTYNPNLKIKHIISNIKIVYKKEN